VTQGELQVSWGGLALVSGGIGLALDDVSGATSSLRSADTGCLGRAAVVAAGSELARAHRGMTEAVTTSLESAVTYPDRVMEQLEAADGSLAKALDGVQPGGGGHR
jgi:hypothetical protein